jgi:hypothetical protein
LLLGFGPATLSIVVVLEGACRMRFQNSTLSLSYFQDAIFWIGLTKRQNLSFMAQNKVEYVQRRLLPHRKMNNLQRASVNLATLIKIIVFGQNNKIVCFGMIPDTDVIGLDT